MKTVFVIREKGPFDEVLHDSGIKVVNVPSIRTVAEDDLSALHRALDRQSEFNGIFVSSSVAAGVLAEEFERRGIGFGGTLFVVGERSLGLLKGFVRDVFKDRSFPSAASLLEEIDDGVLQKGHYLFVRGNRSLGLISQTLNSLVELEEVVAYRTENREIGEHERQSLVNAAGKDERSWLSFFSPSGAESLINQIGVEVVSKFYISAIGQTTADFLKANALEVDLIAVDPSFEIFAKEVSRAVIEKDNN
jgi:uroporphyrinogen-III synthase